MKEDFQYHVRPGKYRHFKGNEYEVVGMARHSETLEEMVIYRSVMQKDELWARPASMWEEIIERDGRSFRRFEFIEE